MEVELDLERGKVLLLTGELAESRRRCAELDSRLSAALNNQATPRLERASRTPNWSPAGSGRQPHRPASPLSGTCAPI